MNERLGKFRLRRTKLLMQKQTINENLKKYENNMGIVLKRIDHIHERVAEVNVKLKAIDTKIVDCQESIDFHSKN